MKGTEITTKKESVKQKGIGEMGFINFGREDRQRSGLNNRKGRERITVFSETSAFLIYRLPELSLLEQRTSNNNVCLRFLDLHLLVEGIKILA